jgi:O-antigen ligase
LILPASLVAISLASPWFLSRRVRLFFAVPLSVLQIYLPGSGIGGFMPPLALLGGVALWPEFIRGLKILSRWPPTLILLGIMLSYAVSLLWSVDVRMGVRAIVYLYVFLAIFSAVFIQIRRQEDVVFELLLLTVLIALVEAALVVVFRVNPFLELAFLHSDIARWFISPNVLSVLFTTGRNNVLDPTKAGGLFTNGNVAGAYLWIMAMTSLVLARRCGRWMYGIFFVMLIGAYFTGSKSVVILVSLLAPVALVSLVLRSKFRIVWLMLGFLIIGSLGAIAVVAPQLESSGAHEKSSSFIHRSNSTLDVRVKIWGYALEAFPEHPLRGQGFGGWQQGFPAYAASIRIPGRVPPQNTLIYLWSQGGLIAAALGGLFMVWVVMFWLRSMMLERNRDSKLAMAGGLSFAFVFAQAMGTNYSLVGEAHMIPVLASLLALGYAVSRKSYEGYLST